ncbi:potassium/sodium hyperpolarization-activated cyclic nucleotide-gated channel 4-like isoform X2 [Bolinopsis microptera]|uniref:potassium/sodium hyperpolarization-activated cyclic nucleotide-gated channel 4-like isoform X2 n=1 Tax=Bolinopsis microptera TaxID=2820187 RepID=UPI0030795CE2
MSYVQHDLENIDELAGQEEGNNDTVGSSDFTRFPRLEVTPIQLPPIIIPRRSNSSKTSSKTSSHGSRKSLEVLHLSSTCENNVDSEDEEESPLHINQTTSNENMLSADHKKTVLEKISSETLRKQSTSSEPCHFKKKERKDRHSSFAAYHKCRSRSMSVPEPKQAQMIKKALGIASSESIHRTSSGLGLMGEKVAEEELGKSKILALFEADITNKKVKTFYNGVVGVLEDRQRQDKIINEDKIFIIHPLSSFRLIWDTVLLAAIMIMMVVLPLKLSFFKIFDDKSREEERKTWYPIVIVLDLIFLCDVVASFFTGTIEQKQNPPLINLNRKEIQLRYLKTWFVPDLLSSIPFDVIGSELAGNANGSGTNNTEIGIALGASKAFLAAKVLKMFSLIRIFELSPLVIKILQLLCFFFMIAHWSACTQFFVVYVRDFPAESWVVRLKIDDKAWTEQYIWAIFRSLSHMITIGYGHEAPRDTVEVIMIIPSMLIGAFFYMMIVSQMTKTISMFRMGDIRYTEKLKDIDELTRRFNMSPELHQRMHEYFHHKYGGTIHDDDSLIKELPLALKIDVIKSKYNDMIENVFFLRSACDGFMEQFILSTIGSVYMTGDIIIRSEDIIENLFVIKKGTVSIEFTTPGNTLEDEIIVRSFGFFGETPMLLKKKADMVVYAETACDFLMIPKYMFYSLMERYPLFKNQMLLVCHSRIVLQGIDPEKHAPFLKNDFDSAGSDRIAARSSEDILELASQKKMDPAHMEEFRCSNSIKHSVFRKVDPRKKGEKPPSSQTPIDHLNEHHDPAIHVSVSIHDDRIKTSIDQERSFHNEKTNT